MERNEPKIGWSGAERSGKRELQKNDGAERWSSGSCRKTMEKSGAERWAGVTEKRWSGAKRSGDRAGVAEKRWRRAERSGERELQKNDGAERWSSGSCRKTMEESGAERWAGVAEKRWRRAERSGDRVGVAEKRWSGSVGWKYCVFTAYVSLYVDQVTDREFASFSLRIVFSLKICHKIWYPHITTVTVNRHYRSEVWDIISDLLNASVY